MTRVLVVDDDALVRSGLRLMLGEAEDITIVAEATDGDEVPAAVAEHRPDVVLMDLRMPRVDGVRATAELLAGTDPPAVLVLTTFDSDQDVLAALRAGATGYLVKDTPPADIEDAIRRVAAGGTSLSSSVTRRLIAAATGGDGRGGREDRSTAASTRLAALSEQERAVAAAVGRGWGNARISTELWLSLSTVKTYLSSALAKLDLDNRTQLALLAHDAGLSTEDDGGDLTPGGR
ncbi:LuxR family two component transcriptional regulator [Actinomycetospora succinea]|uniref:LuxR family two component transcriptional regulator n=1 Tax=Actinomycetospora succinea TaxID=663603 RepID=A0A4R6VPB5_9PSEU|nr:response regulator transcription factor [Actinomycetospora succinea]TDQ65749.1 LuxR family two component transcriptional regulator [Actinomycetospora succinea]